MGCDWEDTQLPLLPVLNKLGKLLEFEGSKWMLEQIPHFSQCIILTALSIERYILVCYSTRATELLQPRKRVLFYIIVTLLFLVLSSVSVFDTFSDIVSRKVSERRDT